MHLQHSINIFFLISLTTHIRFCIAQNIECSTSKQCIGNDITVSGTVTATGYKSIFNASITADNYIYCKAAFSCSKSSISSPSSIFCGASYSCSYSSLTSSDISCSGSNSCIYTQFNTTSSIMCESDKSCSNSLIYGPEYVYAYGAYSLYNSTIYSANGIVVELSGYQAGFGATLHCESGHECTIRCRNNGCYMFYLDCNGICIIDTANSPFSIQSITDVSLFDASKLKMSSYAYAFDDYQEQNGVSLNISITKQPMAHFNLNNIMAHKNDIMTEYMVLLGKNLGRHLWTYYDNIYGIYITTEYICHYFNRVHGTSQQHLSLLEQYSAHNNAR